MNMLEMARSLYPEQEWKGGATAVRLESARLAGQIVVTEVPLLAFQLVALARRPECVVEVLEPDWAKDDEEAFKIVTLVAMAVLSRDEWPPDVTSVTAKEVNGQLVMRRVVYEGEVAT